MPASDAPPPNWLTGGVFSIPGPFNNGPYDSQKSKSSCVGWTSMVASGEECTMSFKTSSRSFSASLLGRVSKRLEVYQTPM